MAEIHPFAHDARRDGAGQRRHRRDRYLQRRSSPSAPTEGSYADPDAHVEHNVCYSWQHGYQDVFAALPARDSRSSTCTSSPSRSPPSGSAWSATTTAGGTCPDGHGGRREDLPFIYSVMARKAGGERCLTSYLKSNLAMWDEMVDIHEASALYDVKGFSRGATR